MLLLVQVILVISVIVGRFSRVEFEDLRSAIPDEIRIVRHEYEGCLVIEEGIEEYIFRYEIEVVRRFVEEEKVSGMEKELYEKEPRSFTSA